MSEIWMRGSEISAIPGTDFKTYGPRVTEVLRKIFVSTYISAILTSYKLGNTNLDYSTVFRCLGKRMSLVIKFGKNDGGTQVSVRDFEEGEIPVTD